MNNQVPSPSFESDHADAAPDENVLPDVTDVSEMMGETRQAAVDTQIVPIEMDGAGSLQESEFVISVNHKELETVINETVDQVLDSNTEEVIQDLRVMVVRTMAVRLVQCSQGKKRLYSPQEIQEALTYALRRLFGLQFEIEAIQ